MTTQTTVSETTIFTGDAQPSTEGTGDLLINTLVGEGKKFKTPEDLAKGKLEADRFIEQVKLENAELRKQLEERTTLEQSLEEIKKARANPAGKELEPANSALDEKELQSLIQRTIDSAAKNKELESNILLSDRAVVEHMAGDRAKAEQFLKSKAAELNVGIDFLMSMAGRSPKAFLSLIGVDTSKVQTSTHVSPKSSVNTDADDYVPNGGSPKAGTKEYYENLRRTNAKVYWTPKIQNEIFQARKEGRYS